MTVSDCIMDSDLKHLAYIRLAKDLGGWRPPRVTTSVARPRGSFQTPRDAPPPYIKTETQKRDSNSVKQQGHNVSGLCQLVSLVAQLSVESLSYNIGL